MNPLTCYIELSPKPFFINQSLIRNFITSIFTIKDIWIFDRCLKCEKNQTSIHIIIMHWNKCHCFENKKGYFSETSITNEMKLTKLGLLKIKSSSKQINVLKKVFDWRQKTAIPISEFFLLLSLIMRYYNCVQISFAVS